MGCCFSCFNSGDNKSQSGEPNERTTLLSNPVSNSISRPLFSQDFSDTVPGQFGDEQAAFSKILHKTAVDIIDVSAVPHMKVEDYGERSMVYKKRLLTLQWKFIKNERLLLKDFPLTDAVLSENPLHIADMRMMNDAFIDVQQALKSVEVEPQGDLVTKFGVS
ncbi:Ragulator complex protein LAMTOR1, partial [Stegodyphus mimosarum]